MVSFSDFSFESLVSCDFWQTDKHHVQLACTMQCPCDMTDLEALLMTSNNRIYGTKAAAMLGDFFVLCCFQTSLDAAVLRWKTSKTKHCCA